jgi:hypothetical protein
VKSRTSHVESRAQAATALIAGEDMAKQVSTRFGSRRRSMRLVGIVLLSLLVVGACGRNKAPGGAESKPLETVDVDEGPEAGLTTEFDERAVVRPAQEVAGVLPSDFPSDVQVFSPSSLVDFGSPGTERYIVVDTSVPIERVRATLAAQMSGAGWGSLGASGEAMVYSKTGRQLRVVLQDLSAGTRIRYEY